MWTRNVSISMSQGVSTLLTRNVSSTLNYEISGIKDFLNFISG